MKILGGSIARQVIYTYAGLALLVLLVTLGSIAVVEFTRQAAIVEARQHQDMALLSAKIRSETLTLTNEIQLYVVTPGSKKIERHAITAQIALLEDLLQQAAKSVDSNDVDESFALGDIRQYLISFNVQGKYVLNIYDKEGFFGPQTQKQMGILVNNYQPALINSLEKFADFERNIANTSFNQGERNIKQVNIGFIFLSIITIISAFIMTWQIVKRFALPLTMLTESVKHLPDGSLNRPPIPITTNDEMGELAEAINSMAREVSASRHQLEQYASTLETQVEERTQELKRLATIDSLTGIFNRRQFIFFSEKLVAEAQRYNDPISFIMIDVDHFKSVNDTYGHAAGDDVLKKVARLVLEQIRVVDIFGRYGGDEFSLTLPQTPLSQAMRVAERISSSIQIIAFKESTKKFQVTISIGVANKEKGKKETLDQSLQKADRALYQAKESGRNQICTYTQTQENV